MIGRAGRVWDQAGADARSCGSVEERVAARSIARPSWARRRRRSGAGYADDDERIETARPAVKYYRATARREVTAALRRPGRRAALTPTQQRLQLARASLIAQRERRVRVRAVREARRGRQRRARGTSARGWGRPTPWRSPPRCAVAIEGDSTAWLRDGHVRDRDALPRRRRSSRTCWGVAEAWAPPATRSRTRARARAKSATAATARSTTSVAVGSTNTVAARRRERRRR